MRRSNSNSPFALGMAIVLSFFTTSCNGCVDVEGYLRDATVDSHVPFAGSLVGVTLDATQAFDAAAQTHLVATMSWGGSEAVSVVVDWGDGTTSDLGSFLDAASLASMHQYQSLGSYTVVATLCLGDECLQQSLGTVDVACVPDVN